MFHAFVCRLLISSKPRAENPTLGRGIFKTRRRENRNSNKFKQQQTSRAPPTHKLVPSFPTTRKWNLQVSARNWSETERKATKRQRKSANQTRLNAEQMNSRLLPCYIHTYCLFSNIMSKFPKKLIGDAWICVLLVAEENNKVGLVNARISRSF